MENSYRDVHDSEKYYAAVLLQIQASSMSAKQKKDIERFVQELKLGKAGKKVKTRRISSYLQFLLKLHDYFKQDLDSLSDKKLEDFYKDLQENVIVKQNGEPFASPSKDEFVKTLKRYLGWCWGKDSKKYSVRIKWMREGTTKSNKRAITLEQAKLVVENATSLRDKTLFLFLFDSGARIEEALNVRAEDLKIIGKDKNLSYMVHLRGQKTIEADRTIAIPLASKLIEEWLAEVQNKEQILFPLKYETARKVIQTISKKTLKFALAPHELRHSSATHYIQHGGFGAENLGGFYYRYGWRFGSKEALTYVKTYLYSGEIAQTKVLRSIANNEIELLKEQLSELTQELQTREQKDEKIIALFKELKLMDESQLLKAMQKVKLM